MQGWFQTAVKTEFQQHFIFHNKLTFQFSFKLKLGSKLSLIWKIKWTNWYFSAQSF